MGRSKSSCRVNIKKRVAQAKIDTLSATPDTALKRNLRTEEAIRTLSPLLEKEIKRYVMLGKKIDAAFGGQPFLLDEPPTSATQAAF
jgi:hypothetical protein